MTKTEMIGAAVKYGFRINTMLDREARRLGASPTTQLVGTLREVAGSHNLPPGTKPANLLADLVIHTQDIRRPLGMPRDIPPERLRSVADMSVSSTGFGVKKRIKGLKLRATDLDWSAGSGPEVTGPAEALILAMNGRPAALADLSGDGLATLESRVRA